MIPVPWQAVILVLATHRLVRLVGWDHMPWLVKARAWISGEQATNTGTMADRMRLTATEPTTQVGYRRPFWHDLFQCPWCLSVWIGIPIYVAWYFEPWWTTTISAPLALSAAVGVVARWLDP